VLRSGRGLALACAAAALLCALPASAHAASACSLSATGGVVTRTIGGRPYDLFVPAGLTRPAPLLLSIHGQGQPRSFHEGEVGWPDFAAARGLIVAWPQGSGPTATEWDYTHDSGDVGFLRAVVADVAAAWCVRADEVDAEGYSAGALMAQRLACDAADVFAAVASFAAPFPPTWTGSACAPARPVAIGIFEGALDPNYLFIGSTHAPWVARDGCPSAPVVEPGVPVAAARYAPCNGGVEVDWRVYATSHNWPIGLDASDIRERMWGLFERNRVPLLSGVQLPAATLPTARLPRRLRLEVSPSHVPAGRRTTLHFRVVSRVHGHPRPVAGAVVRFGDRRVRTDRHGRAELTTVVTAPGERPATATKPDYRRGSTRLEIAPPLRRH
jgi:polyhydroxybutyrate depolymerase